jgi:hypothetical protein
VALAEGSFMSRPTQSEARICGITYLVAIVSGLFAEAYVRGGVYFSGDPQATMMQLRATESMFRLGIASDLLMLSCYIAVTVLLYRMFRGTNAALSSIAAGFSLTGIAVLAIAVVALRAALLLAAGGDAAGVSFALRMQGATYGVSLVFFGVYNCLIGALILRGRLLPAAVGWLMFLAGIAFLLNNVAEIVAPHLAAQIPPVTMLTSLIGEGAVGLWLAIFGVRQPIFQTQP